MTDNKNIEVSAVDVNNVTDISAEQNNRKWFVAIVKNNTEKVVAQRLADLGYEIYLPSQVTYRVWKNGRKAKVDRVVIRAVVFIHCTEQERKEVLTFPYVYRFMVDAARSRREGGSHALAVVSDFEISRLKFLLEQSDIPVEISSRCYKKGDHVRVIRGGLKDLEGEVVDTNDSKSELVVALDILGCAKLLIDTVNLEVITNT